MIQKKISETRRHYSLGFLLLLVAINAFAGGYCGMSGAENIPTAWLTGSPFRNYFIPSLILFFCVGGSAFFAAIAVLQRFRTARKMAFISGIIILGWLAVQESIIGYVSWMQPATATAALLILLLTWKLPVQHH